MQLHITLIHLITCTQKWMHGVFFVLLAEFCQAHALRAGPRPRPNL